MATILLKKKTSYLSTGGSVPFLGNRWPMLHFYNWRNLRDLGCDTCQVLSKHCSKLCKTKLSRINFRKANIQQIHQENILINKTWRFFINSHSYIYLMISKCWDEDSDGGWCLPGIDDGLFPFIAAICDLLLIKKKIQHLVLCCRYFVLLR